jgi:NAD(P)-dependent dehydrogenase (short-subunit alcohol dehydrogenase family)
MATVAITGAGRGIGLELVRQHLDAGDNVVALVRNPAGAGELKELVASSGDRLSVHQMDVGNDASVKAGASGAGAVDILYNVAGVAGPVAPELDGANWDEWADVFNIMVQGPLRVLQAFLPRLGAGSKVINISSQLAASTWPYGGFYAYSAAKAGLNRMMRSVAIDVKDRGIIIGLVHPGWVQTDMGGPGADITPDESASGIMAVAKGWTLDESGDFKKWNGEVHPW